MNAICWAMRLYIKAQPCSSRRLLIVCKYLLSVPFLFKLTLTRRLLADKNSALKADALTPPDEK